MLEIFNAPLDSILVDNLDTLWRSAFGKDFVTDVPRALLTENAPLPHTVDVYTKVIERRIVSGAVAITGGSFPILGGLGEVSTVPEFRGSGFATEICREVLHNFFDSSGKALYLGTTNPTAARIYSKLGWKEIPKTKLMVKVGEEDSYSEFIEDYFLTASPYKCSRGEMLARIPLIPLAIVPSDWDLLDINIGLLSTLQEEQESCLGLYRRYDQIRIDGLGEFFTLADRDGRLIGISTAVKKDEGYCLLDGFTHPLHKYSFIELLKTALDWGEAEGLSSFKMEIADTDQEKAELAAGLGFKLTDERSVFEGRYISCNTHLFTLN